MLFFRGMVPFWPATELRDSRMDMVAVDRTKLDPVPVTPGRRTLLDLGLRMDAYAWVVLRVAAVLLLLLLLAMLLLETEPFLSLGIVVLVVGCIFLASKSPALLILRMDLRP